MSDATQKYGGHWSEKLAKQEPEIVQGDLDKLVCHVCGKEINTSYKSEGGKHRHIACELPQAEAPKLHTYYLLSEECRKAVAFKEPDAVACYVTGVSNGRARVAVGESLFDFPFSDLTQPITEVEAYNLHKVEALKRERELVRAKAQAEALGVIVGKPTGRKDDQDKARWDLLPFGSVAQVVDVLTYGAKKYAPDNWQKVPNPKGRYVAAALRHLSAYAEGEKVDPESGKPHLAHAVCCLLFLMWFDK
jgi:hypothetical protein